MRSAVTATMTSVLLLAVATTPARAAGGALTMDDAVRVALERNREVIAARLEIEAAQLDVVAARIYPNPIASYSVGNLVLGTGNGQPTAGGVLRLRSRLRLEDGSLIVRHVA